MINELAIFISVFISVGIIIFSMVDEKLYRSVPFKIRSGHWWSYLPGSGFYAKYLQYKKEKK